MATTLVVALGGACVAHVAGTLWGLGRQARRVPQARDARTGRPLHIRLDRRRTSRRSRDR